MNNLLELRTTPADRRGSGFTYFDHVVARLLDFFAESRQWHRRLWTIGSVLARPVGCGRRMPLTPSAERLARAVAAHLLDCGFSSAFLHRWTRGVVGAGAGLPQLLEESAMLVRRPDRTFEILVPFESVPRQSTLTSHIREWRSAPAVAEWLARHAGGTAGIRQNGGFVYEIKATNRERALLVADALRSGRTLALARPADLAAELRVRDLLNAPRPALRRVEEHVRRTLRQLYRQRNIVLHAGATQPVALSACLRASAPLVGAGLDRITHAYLASGTKPLQIAARARLRLDLVGSNEGRSVVDLLE